MSDLKQKIEAPRVDWLDRQQVISDLDAIYRVIDRQGWVQGMLGRSGGPRCLRGAIYEVIDGSYVGRRDRTVSVFHALGFVADSAMVRWQDEVGRTKGEVLARIQDAKALLSK